MFKTLIVRITLIIKIYIIDPILRWWNLHFRGYTIEDNQRNNELLQYFYKLVDTPSYQPSTPVENYAENYYIKKTYDILKEDNQNLEYTDDVRSYIAAIFVIKSREYFII